MVPGFLGLLRQFLRDQAYDSEEVVSPVKSFHNKPINTSKISKLNHKETDVGHLQTRITSQVQDF